MSVNSKERFDANDLNIVWVGLKVCSCEVKKCIRSDRMQTLFILV